MKILVAEDNNTSRLLLERLLSSWGYEPIPVADGKQACITLLTKDPPPIAILDWDMPEITGVEICKMARENPQLKHLYLILLTAKGSRADVIKGLQAGADDYVLKPFDSYELQARIQVGIRVAQLNQALKTRIKELEDTRSIVKQLRGLIPICSYCKKIRDDQNYWQQVEEYIGKHSEVRFSHGICPECCEQVRQKMPTRKI